MDSITADLLSRKLHISQEVIVREEYEMIILRGLMASRLNEKLIFKGGTALRLAYQSPRFSEDLDFSLRQSIKQSEFEVLVRQIIELLPSVKIKDLREKYYTHFGLLLIKEPYLKQAFSIKIEISKRIVRWKRGKDFDVVTCKSEVVPLETVGLVVTLERALKDKQKALKTRKKARDIFDSWWLGQKLGKPIKFELTKEEVKRAKSELDQFLPQHMRMLIESWRKS